ncbi:MAG: 50S ribosome-binding GTPase [Micrococcales bacterium]|nr:50S ribosome-binding GTPase [Micrococcales bacterium]
MTPHASAPPVVPVPDGSAEPVQDDQATPVRGLPAQPLHGEQTARVADRAARLTAIVDEAADVLDDATVAAVRSALDRVRMRLDLGVDRTVVAIVGGTGSGKSSLFNAVTGLQFADVGDTRPTTSAMTACVWGADGGPVLDWLGVDPRRRIQRESLLDAGDQDYLAGLVLLDLPDHDSVATAHREVVDEVLPQADLVVWVVDPQKYADAALHTGYLRDLQGRDTATLVVLNQIDTVPVEYRRTLVADLARLVVTDGLSRASVQAVSALTGDGVPALRARLAEAVSGRSAAAEHAWHDLSAVAGLLVDALGPRVEPPTVDALPPVVETLTQAAGLDAAADACASALRSGGQLDVLGEALGTVHAEGAELARHQWLDRATASLLPAWAKAVEHRVATADELRQATSDALTGITLGARRSGLVEAGWWVSGVLGLVAVVTLLGTVSADAWVVPLVVGLLLALAAGGVLAAAWWWRRTDADRCAARLVVEGRAVVRAAATVRLVDPTADVYARLRRLQDQVAQIR